MATRVMSHYVTGFAFVRDSDSDMMSELVTLIKKLRPEWQYGKYNGVGGHVEPSETIWQAMVREFKEETGVETQESDWTNFACIEGKEFTCEFFSCCLPWHQLKRAKSQTDETVIVTSFYSINRFNAIPNLTWLLPMSRNLQYEISPRRAKKIILKEVYE